MSKNWTMIGFVLDRSGSMNAIKSDVIGGFNEFLTNQAAFGRAKMSLTKFNTDTEVGSPVPIGEIPALTTDNYICRGNTALYDAIGLTIEMVGVYLYGLPEQDRAKTVIFVIQTDGFENASKEYTKGAIAELIKRQREVYNWEFIFLGTNFDAFAVAESMNIGRGQTMTFANNAMGTAEAYTSVNNLANTMRSGVKGATFTEGDYDAQRKAGV